MLSAVAGCEHGAGGAAGSGGARPADTIRRVKVKMSSVSAQGVVERASAELSRRITGMERTYSLNITVGDVIGLWGLQIISRVATVLDNLPASSNMQALHRYLITYT